MLVLVMSGMLSPFVGLHYLDFISMTWRVGRFGVSDSKGGCFQVT